MSGDHWWTGLVDWLKHRWDAFVGVDKAKVEGVAKILDHHLSRKDAAAARSPERELQPEELDAEVKELVKDLNLRPPKSK